MTKVFMEILEFPFCVIVAVAVDIVSGAVASGEERYIGKESKTPAIIFTCFRSTIKSAPELSSSYNHIILV